MNLYWRTIRKPALPQILPPPPIRFFTQISTSYRPLFWSFRLIISVILIGILIYFGIFVALLASNFSNFLTYNTCDFEHTFLGILPKFSLKSLYFHNMILYYISLMNLSTIDTGIVGSGVPFKLKPPNFQEKTSWEHCNFELFWANLTCFSQMYCIISNVFFRFLSKSSMRVGGFWHKFYILH